MRHGPLVDHPLVFLQLRAERFIDEHQLSWRDSSVVRGASCYFRGSEFGS